MMSKYQEALNCIYSDDELKKAFNKNNPDLLFTIEARTYERLKYRIVLQRLVDKATPKKPMLGEIWEDNYTTIYDEKGSVIAWACVCPNCGKYAIYNSEYYGKLKHCTNCGQAIDWNNKYER